MFPTSTIGTSSESFTRLICSLSIVNETKPSFTSNYLNFLATTTTHTQPAAALPDQQDRRSTKGALGPRGRAWALLEPGCAALLKEGGEGGGGGTTQTANSITSSLQQPGRTEWGEEWGILNDRISKSSYPPTAQCTHPTRQPAKATVIQRDGGFNSEAMSSNVFLCRRSSSRVAEAEPCKLSGETLNIYTVVPQTGRPLRTF